MLRTRIASSFVFILLLTATATAERIFVEAEAFVPSSDGWKVTTNPQARRASRATSLHGAAGAPDATASKQVTIQDAGRYRIWVRYMQVRRWRGPFRLAVLRGGQEVAGKVFDLRVNEDVADWEYLWDSFEVDLPAGEVTLRLSKHENKNCVGYVRHVDCILLTTDLKLVPNHLDYGPQTYMRVTLGDVYQKPIYIHVFADHYRSPWYAHYHLSKDGARAGLAPPKKSFLSKGESTPWCNITPMLYQDTGAILNISSRYTYHEKSPRLQATFELATAPDEKKIVRTIRADCEPGGLVIVMPPDLTTPDNLAKLKTDRDVAEQTGKIADAFRWPTVGRKPERFPFLVSARIGGYGLDVDARVTEREWKTLDYYGFLNRSKVLMHGGIWYMHNDSYCQPDLARMKKRAQDRAAEFKQQGKSVADIVFCMLMDEPGGQPSSFVAGDPAYAERFRAWLKKMDKTPADLLVADWDDVKPVVETERDRYPALHYYTQRFRTRALGDFLAVQRHILEEAYGRGLPAGVNFSDGAVYYANFYGQGVDYFELLDSADQNAIWSEDWSNLASSYQCASYNVELMRAAARRHGQMLGHYLIAYARRKPWDIKLKAASEVARGVKILQNFFYGPSWGSHEGGPLWRSSAWYAKPETWRANAEIVREIGGAEDLLLPAMPAKAEVAILYSSSTDVWTFRRNSAYGFDRMHTWLALTHAQIPVDILSEKDVADGMLKGYKACYFSGPNVTRAAAAKLRDWVTGGGTLWLTAGSGMRDEYNRPLDVLDEILPADRKEARQLQPHLSAGKFLRMLATQDEVRVGRTTMEVLSVRQEVVPRPESKIIGTFKDGSAGLVHGRSGSGFVYSVGFLPALSYIKAAQTARAELDRKKQEADEKKTPLTAEERSEVELLDRSYNPWRYPADIRDVILLPVHRSGVQPPLTCSVPLVDAVYMTSENGVLIPLANYTLRPLDTIRLQVRVPRPVKRVESVHRGTLPFTACGETAIEFALPLEATDFLKLYF